MRNAHYTLESYMHLLVCENLIVMVECKNKFPLSMTNVMCNISMGHVGPGKLWNGSL